MRRFQISLLLCAAILGAVLVRGQNPATSDDEIRVASAPYTPEAANAITVQSNLVEVGVVIRDDHGKPVRGLKQEDFLVFDSSRPQKISHFSVEEESPAPTPAPVIVTPGAPPPAPPPAPQPRYIGFYFDDNNMETPDLVMVRKAAKKFVADHLQPTDKAAVFTSSATVTQNFTNDRDKLSAAIDRVYSHYRKASYGSGSCPHIEPYQAYQIVQMWDVHSQPFDLALAEAVKCNCMNTADASCIAQQSNLVQVQAQYTVGLADQFAMNSLGALGDIIRYVGKMPGHRMLVMTSSGYFSMSKSVQKQQSKIIDDALHAGIRVNTLDAKGLSADWLNNEDTALLMTKGAGERADLAAYSQELASDERSVADDSMSAIAEGTGGTFFHNSNDIVGGVRQLAAMPEVSYTLGFLPDEMKSDGAYHPLKVKLVNNLGYTIDARPGYFAPNKAALAPREKLAKLNKQVMGSEELQGIQAGVDTKSILLATGEPALRVEVHVDIHALPFKKENGRHAERLIFITALFDTENKFLSGVEGMMEMNLTDGTLTMLNSSGASAIVTLQAPPGTYRLRQVVQEAVTGRIAAFNTPVEIR
ncbi:MAG: VWA domain-containing protein [Candidatus Acidiferrales bacterium]